jgi:hypothetical protein
MVGLLGFEACTTDVEVVSTASGSSTGQGGAASSGSNVTSTTGGGVGDGGNGGGGGACGTPRPVGTLEFCQGSGSTGTGLPFECQSGVCDDAGNTWTADCDETGACSCVFNSVEVCTCQGAGDACTGVSCCPPPWPDA